MIRAVRHASAAAPKWLVAVLVTGPVLLFLAGVARADVCAYVDSPDDRTIAVIDTAQRAVVARIRVPGCCGAADFKVAADGLIAYLATPVAIDTVDLQTNAMIGVIPLPLTIASPEIAVDPSHSLVYVLTAGTGHGQLPDGGVAVVDVSARAVSALIDISTPRGMGISPDGQVLYVVRAPGGLTILDTQTNTIVGGDPTLDGFAVAFTPDGRSAYVVSTPNPNTNEDAVLVVDTASKALVTKIPIPNCTPVAGLVQCGSSNIAIDPEGQHVYVVNGIDRSISVIDPMQNAVVDMFRLGDPRLGDIVPQPAGIGVTPNGRSLYVTQGSSSGNSVWVVDIASREVSTISVGSSSQRWVTIAEIPHACAGDQITPSATPTVTATSTPSATPTVTSTPTRTATPIATSSPSPTPQPGQGDGCTIGRGLRPTSALITTLLVPLALCAARVYRRCAGTPLRRLFDR